MTALLTGLIAVVATAVGYSNNVTQSDAERAAGTVTLRRPRWCCWPC